MLFGRKNPPAGAPKKASADAAAPVAPQAGPAEPAATASPPASPLSSPPSSLQAAPQAPSPATPASPAPAPAPAPVASGVSSFPSAPQSPAPQSPAPTNRAFSDKGPEMNTSTPKPPTGGSLPGASFKPTDIPRRTVDLPGVAPRAPQGFGAPAAPLAAPLASAASAPAPGAPSASDQRRLIVGRDISLTGEIGSCDVLVVEGTVEAKLLNGRSIEVAESGLFKGSVEIDEADIGGRFEGDITVRGRLIVRSGGKIHGSIKYGELTVECGGRLIGDIQVFSAASKAPSAPAPTPAPAPAVVPLATVDGE